MKRSCKPLFLLAAILAAPPFEVMVGATPSAALQQPEPRKKGRKVKTQKPPKPEKVIAQLSKDLRRLLAARGRKDSAAVQMIGDLVDQARVAKARSKRSVTKILVKVFTYKRNPDETRIYSAAIAGLTAMGPTAVKHLGELVNEPQFQPKERTALRVEMVKALAQTGDTDILKTLLGLLKDEGDRILTATLDGLKNYKKASDKTRNMIVVKILNSYREAMARKTPKGPGTEPTPLQLRKLKDLKKAYDGTLKVFTGQDLSGYDNWAKWWEKNNPGKKVRKPRADRKKDK